jgi:hypothetical protein
MISAEKEGKKRPLNLEGSRTALSRGLLVYYMDNINTLWPNPSMQGSFEHPVSHADKGLAWNRGIK